MDENNSNSSVAATDNQPPKEVSKNEKALMIPSAIVLAGLLIAGALIFNGHRTPSTSTPTPANPGAIGAAEITMNPVTSSDHILGSLKSKVFIVEYADMECPYCKAYEPELNKVMSAYGTSSGQVAWVFRHFPIHSRGPYEAAATECAADQGGNDIFFKYVDRIFAVTKADNNLDPKILTQTAGELGLDTKVFQSCLDSGKYKDKIQASYDEAVKAGARGTPYTVMVTSDGHKYPLTDQSGNPVGAVSFEDLKGVIDNLLKTVK
jgi:protein-disulfide isomerase